MRKMEIIIRPDLRNAAKDALEELGVHGMTVTEVRGHGRQGGYKEVYRGKEVLVDFVDKIKVEVVVEAEKSEAIIEAMRRVAASGKMGDGKIFVYPIADIVRIRTGERGRDAL